MFLLCLIQQKRASLVAQMVIYLPCGRLGFNPWLGKILWRREWQPTPVFLSGEFHGQRSLASYSPWGFKESDTAERLIHTFSRGMCLATTYLSTCTVSPAQFGGGDTEGKTNEVTYLRSRGH